MRQLLKAVTATLCVLATLLSGDALAQKAIATDATATYDIGGKPIKLGVLPGFCALEPAHPVDQQLIAQVNRVLAGQNELVTQAVACQQLQELRKGERVWLNDFSQVQVLGSLKTRDLTGQEAAAVKGICSTLRASGDKLAADANPDIRQRLETVLNGVKVGDINVLGIIAEDPEACYMAAVQSATDASGKIRNLLSINATTIVGGRLIYIYRFAEPAEKQSIETLLADLRTFVANQIKANNGRPKTP
jgi:hypothetical protein